MSQIVILGASGKLGSHLLTEALDAGWLVHALSRDPSRIRRANERLTLYQGDAESGVGLEVAISGSRYVIFAVDSSHPADCVAHIIKAVGLKAIERLIFISRRVPVTGSLSSAGKLASLLPKVRRNISAELDRAAELLRLSGLPYCIFRATELTEEAPGHELVITRDSEAPPGPLSRADFARFIIHSLSDRAWNLKEVTVGTKGGPK